MFYSSTMESIQTLQQVSNIALYGIYLSNTPVSDQESWAQSQSRDKTAASSGMPMYCRALHCKSPAFELKDAAPLAKAVMGWSAAPCDPDGTARGDGLQVHLLLEQLIPSVAAGKQLITPVERVLEGAAFDSSCYTQAIFITWTQVIILTEIPSKRLTGRL